MRVLLMLAMLLITPFLSAQSQDRGRGQKKERKVVHAGRHVAKPKFWAADRWCRKHASHWLARENNDRNKHVEACIPAPTPPPPAPVPTGIAEIHGAVFLDSDANGVRDFYDVGAPGWSVELSGPVSALVETNDNGDYIFPALPGGTYTVCEQQQDGYTQTFPPENSCYQFDVPSELETWIVSIDFGTAAATAQ